jgi:hypothetical protein
MEGETGPIVNFSINQYKVMKTKEEKNQIEAQKETIESLTRKVESLETELQKCLDPDSGEFKFQPIKSNTAQEVDIKLSKDGLSERLYNVIHAAFIPVRNYYSSHEKKWNKMLLPWWYFRESLFDMDVFSDHWSIREFRFGVHMLNDICQATEDFSGDVEHFDKFEFAFRLFYCGSPEGDIQKKIGASELVSALHLIIKNQEISEIEYVNDRELIGMMEVLKVIQACQLIWEQAGESEREKDANSKEEND